MLLLAQHIQTADAMKTAKPVTDQIQVIVLNAGQARKGVFLATVRHAANALKDTLAAAHTIAIFNVILAATYALMMAVLMTVWFVAITTSLCIQKTKMAISVNTATRIPTVISPHVVHMTLLEKIYYTQRSKASLIRT